MKNKRIHRQIIKIRKFEKEYIKFTDEQLKNKTYEFKERLKNGEKLDSLLPEAFAVISESSYRILRKRPYNVQLFAAIVIHQCYLAEMKTGEGKTLTAIMPLYLNALTEKSVILVTANEFLANRDSEEMKKVFNFLNISVGCGVPTDKKEQLTNEEKKEIYSADIVYTTHSALGFDYLLNNLVQSFEEKFMRDFYYIIIDEADSVLLDSSHMPLVISGSPRVQSNILELADFFVSSLKEDIDFEKEEKKVWLTEDGINYAEKFFLLDNIFKAENFEIYRSIILALRAHELFERDRDYIISEDGKIVLLDNATGRKLPGMKLRGGQQQAIEIKEKLNVTSEDRSVASITYQNLFNMFPRLSGMSGTIADAKAELNKVYGKKIVIVPTNKPVKRIDYPDKYYVDSQTQINEAINEVIGRHSVGQPVLIVTSTISDTELISKVLVKFKIPHNVLNANNAYWESEIIAEAGQINAVTVSTGMAGRGTDITLGDGVEQLGGLFVIGIGRMENKRLERQARGRAGRQGDAGGSRFFVSLEDEIVYSTYMDKIKKIIESKKKISNFKLKRVINNSQKIQEEIAIFQRHQSTDFDSCIKRQREIIYEIRDKLLSGSEIQTKKIKKIFNENIDNFMKNKTDINRYILDNLSYSLNESFLEMKNAKSDQQRVYLQNIADSAFREKAQELDNRFQEYLRLCALRAIDISWIEQVDYLQQLQYAVMGRSTAQRNIIFEYQKEAYRSYKKLEVQVKNELMKNILLSRVYFNEKNEMMILFP